MAWAGEAADGVVHATLAVDHERPVAGLQEQQLAGAAAELCVHGRVASPRQAGEQVGEARFAAVLGFPQPAGVIVEPHVVTAAGTPAAFGQGDEFVGRVFVEHLLRGDEFHRARRGRV